MARRGRAARALRRLLVAGALAAVASSAFPDGADAAASPVILFGARPHPKGTESYPQAATNLESQLGRTVAAVRVYYFWDQAFPDTYGNWLVSTNHPMLLSVKAKRVNGTFVLWRDIATAQPGSALYGDIVTWATRVKNVGSHVYFIFNHEPESSASAKSGTAPDFIDAWRKVITVFRDQGVTNAEYVWTITDYSFWVKDNRSAPLWYPGDAYVDDIGADADNWFNCRSGINNPWKSLQQIIDPLRQFGLAHPTKGLMLPEWASTEDPADPARKAQWLADAQALFQSSGWGQFSAILYYSNPSTFNCTWWVDSSASTLSAFKAMANDSYYARVSA